MSLRVAPVNLGFPKACNLGLASTLGRYVLLVNPDVRVTEDCLQLCIAEMSSDPSIGVCGPRLLYPNGEVQPECARRFPSPWWLLCEALFLHRLFPHTRLFGGRNFGEWDHASDRDVPCIVGAFMLFRTGVLSDLGGLDESVFMYYEDLDVCERVWASGYRVRFVSRAVAIHNPGSSRAKSTANLDALYGEVPWRFARQHRGRIQAGAIVPIVAVHALIRLALFPLIGLAYCVRNEPSRWRDLVLGNVGVLAWCAPKEIVERPRVVTQAMGRFTAYHAARAAVRANMLQALVTGRYLRDESGVPRALRRHIRTPAYAFQAIARAPVPDSRIYASLICDAAFDRIADALGLSQATCPWVSCLLSTIDSRLPRP